MEKRWSYPRVLIVAISGLTTIGTGLAFAYLSNPVRFSRNVSDDLAINLYSGMALLFTSIGTIGFLKAASKTIPAMSYPMRRDVNLGFFTGFALQLAAFMTSDPVTILLGVLAAVPFLAWASMQFAEAKGFSKWVGVVGLLGLLGVIVLLLLPNRSNRSQ